MGTESVHVTRRGLFVDQSTESIAVQPSRWPLEWATPQPVGVQNLDVAPRPGRTREPSHRQEPPSGDGSPPTSWSLEPLAQELRRVIESTGASAQSQFEQAKLWRGLNLPLGLPAALRLTDQQRAGLRPRRMTTHRYLAEAFPPDAAMPLVATKLIGSAGRDTIIRPVDDIDVLAVFANAGGRFDRSARDSRRVLYRVTEALGDCHVEVVGARGQVVRMFYQRPPQVDIAAVFRRGKGGYLLPRGDGRWLTTDPDRHERWLNERNAAAGHQLKPMIRLLMRWNREHSARLKSFHLEVLAANAFSDPGELGSNHTPVLLVGGHQPLVVRRPPGRGGSGRPRRGPGQLPYLPAAQAGTSTFPDGGDADRRRAAGGGA